VVRTRLNTGLVAWSLVVAAAVVGALSDVAGTTGEAATGGFAPGFGLLLTAGSTAGSTAGFTAGSTAGSRVETTTSTGGRGDGATANATDVDPDGL
jgi:hypothetical protein